MLPTLRADDGFWADTRATTPARGEVWVFRCRNSFDSRFWHNGAGGGVPRKLLVGRVTPPPPSLPPGAEALAGAFARCKATLGVSP